MTKFETLMQQLSDMAAKGEIGKDEIRDVEYTLMSARRKGQLDARKNEPGYADKKAASLAKAAATRDQSKKDLEASSAYFNAKLKADAQAEQERRSTNKLPLSMSAYRMGVKGTKKALGDFAKYYSDKFNPAGPGGQDSYSLELKPKFKDQSFDDAKNVWDFYDGKKPSSLNEQFTRMKKLAGLITENAEYVPYQFDDKRGKELYKKYEKADENPAWKNIDGNYEKVIKLDILLKITGMTLEELEELNNYGDESWNLFIDKNKNTVTQFID
jgi:hypothetical protein